MLFVEDVSVPPTVVRLLTRGLLLPNRASDHMIGVRRPIRHGAETSYEIVVGEDAGRTAGEPRVGCRAHAAVVVVLTKPPNRW